MSNGEGLKAQWKVTEPRAVAPNSKGGDFRDEYKQEMGGAEANLKVIARDGNAETLTRLRALFASGACFLVLFVSQFLRAFAVA